MLCLNEQRIGAALQNRVHLMRLSRLHAMIPDTYDTRKEKKTERITRQQTSREVRPF